MKQGGQVAYGKADPIFIHEFNHSVKQTISF